MEKVLTSPKTQKAIALEHGVHATQVKLFQGSYLNSDTDEIWYGINLAHFIIGFVAFIDSQGTVWDIRRAEQFDTDIVDE
jgi:hypothetical protein